MAQVAAEDPETEPNTPQASTTTCRSRPGSQFTQGAMPRKICSERRVRNRISPIHTKSGSAASSKLVIVRHWTDCIIAPMRMSE